MTTAPCSCSSLSFAGEVAGPAGSVACVVDVARRRTAVPVGRDAVIRDVAAVAVGGAAARDDQPLIVEPVLRGAVLAVAIDQHREHLHVVGKGGDAAVAVVARAATDRSGATGGVD